MMRLAVLLVSLSLGAMPLACRAATPEPYEAVRALQKLQDRMATGDEAAQAAHSRAIVRTAEAFVQAKASTWSDKRNARALVAYLFSGGSASAIADGIQKSSLAPSYAALYEGALAYGLGNDEAARKILMPIDARTQPSGLGGHLALVQATLAAQTDQAGAIAFLDLARLLEPGTLIEEAALRKEISLIGATGDLDKFAMLTRRYLSAFPKSLYADNFKQLVAQDAMQLGAVDTDEAGAKLVKLVAGLGAEERRGLFLTIARDAVIAGRLKIGALASEQAGRLAQGSERDQAKALVYFGAATIVGDKYENGLRALRTAAPGRLDVQDRALLESALGVAETIHTPALAGTDDKPVMDGQAAVLADGERSLAVADAMLTAAAR
jgi:chemotaxis protein MotC